MATNSPMLYACGISRYWSISNLAANKSTQNPNKPETSINHLAVHAMTLIYSVLCIIIFSALTFSSPITNPNFHQPTPRTNLTTPRQLYTPQCLNSEDWVTPSFLPGDCYTCIDKLHNRDTDKWHTIPLDFVSYLTPQHKPSTWTQTTPRRYKYKSCTVAVVLLKDMPGATPPGKYPAHDEVSYAAVELSAREIIARCLSPVMGEKRERGLGFANPTGFEIIGTLIPVISYVSFQLPWRLLTCSRRTRPISWRLRLGYFFSNERAGSDKT